MCFSFCLSKGELWKALKDIEIAEKNGFNYCVPIFKLDSISDELDERIALYSDLWERASPIDGSLDWGRGQNVTKLNIFKDGHLVKREDL